MMNRWNCRPKQKRGKSKRAERSIGFSPLIPAKQVDVVGITGSTGRSTGEHLHISCKLDGKSVDPLMVLDYIKSIREECVAALAESRETSSLSLADEKYR